MKTTKIIKVECPYCHEVKEKEVPLVRCLNCKKTIDEPSYCSPECWEEDMKGLDYRMLREDK